MSNDKGIPEFLSNDSIPERNDSTLSKFRSITIKSTDEVHTLSSSSFHSKVDTGYAELSTRQVKSMGTIFQLNKTSTTCPERPFCLMRTHFELDTLKIKEPIDGKTKFDKIMEFIDLFLSDIRDYDFSRFDTMWKGKYLQGSNYCEIHVNIYTQTAPSANYIIEANRVEGDSKPFFAFYRELKASMLTEPDTAKPFNNNFYFEPLSTSKISPEQFLGGVQPIFNMADEPFFETRLEAAKMLCDLALHPERTLLQLSECVTKCVASLAKLVADSFEYVRQHAMCALAAFVEVPGYCDAIARSSALNVLVGQVENPCEPAYETIQSRRECARVMAVVARHDAAIVLDTLAQAGTPVQEYLSKVDSISDAHLKRHAQKMKEWLQNPSGSSAVRKSSPV